MDIYVLILLVTRIKHLVSSARSIILVAPVFMKMRKSMNNDTITNPIVADLFWNKWFSSAPWNINMEHSGSFICSLIGLTLAYLKFYCNIHLYCNKQDTEKYAYYLKYQPVNFCHICHCHLCESSVHTFLVIVIFFYFYYINHYL